MGETIMNCNALENLWIDYFDHTLDDAVRREVEEHLRQCKKCTALVAEMRADLLLVDALPEVEPPTRLIHNILAGTSGIQDAPPWYESPFDFIRPQQLPKFAMGMLMAVASLAVLLYASGIDFRNIKPADLTPSKLWEATNREVHLAYSRGVKYYNALRIVYEIQTRLGNLNASVDPEKTAPAQQPQESVPNSAPKSGTPRSISEDHDPTQLLALNLEANKKHGGLS